jgi:hypothetical protein
VIHDARFAGADYRERWRLKKLARRWRQRLATMPPLERQLILETIADLNAADGVARRADTEGAAAGGAECGRITGQSEPLPDTKPHPRAGGIPSSLFTPPSALTGGR